MKLSNNTIERICRVFGYLDILEKKDIEFVSSRVLAEVLGMTEHSLRKDISLLEVTGYSRKGYNVASLKRELGEKLHLSKKRKACIVGLGRLGTALLDYEKFREDGFEIVAGFDCSVNKIERLKTQIDVFAMSNLDAVVAERDIELGIITVPGEVAQEVADRLVSAGIRGILNFSPESISLPGEVVYIDMDFTSSLRFIAAQFVLRD